MNIDTRLQQIDRLLSRWDSTHAPGLVVAIAQRGCTLYRRAFGMASLEAHVANSPSTRMRIGSTSKHFLALLALLLQEEGCLDLDAPIDAYVPELTGVNARPTVRQLLQHRGGTRCHVDLGFIGHGAFAPPPGCALATLRRQQGCNFPPGTAMIYNNGGYHLASLAVSRVSGRPLSSVLEQRVLRPLRMSATELVPSDYLITPGMAGLHVPSPDGGWSRGIFSSHEVLGEGGIVSTVDDMLVWAAHLRSHDRFGAPESWRQLTAPAAERDGTPGYYGLGIMAASYRGVPVLRHAGGVMGGASEMISAAESELDIVILSNGAREASPVLLANRVMDILLEDQLGPAAVPPAAAPLEGRLGDYGSRHSGMVYGLEQENGAVMLRVAKYPAAMGLELMPDGSWETGLTGLGKIKVSLTPGGEDIAIEFAGLRERLSRLHPDTAPAFSGNLTAERFCSEESGIEAQILDTGAGLIMRTRDQWGSAEFDLLPIDAHWAHLRSRPDPSHFGAVMYIPPDKNGQSFILNSARTRNLVFNRVPQ